MLFREATFVLCLRVENSEANRGPHRDRVACVGFDQSDWMSCCAVASVLQECHRRSKIVELCEGNKTST